MKKMIALVLMLAFLTVSGPAFAELLEGEVVSLDFEESSMTVTKEDETSITVWVTEDTAYSGEVTAFEEMLEGDLVKIEAGQDAETGNWMATSVEVPLLIE